MTTQVESFVSPFMFDPPPSMLPPNYGQMCQNVERGLGRLSISFSGSSQSMIPPTHTPLRQTTPTIPIAAMPPAEFVQPQTTTYAKAPTNDVETALAELKQEAKTIDISQKDPEETEDTNEPAARAETHVPVLKTAKDTKPYSVSQLREFCNQLRLVSKGRRAELEKRLCTHFSTAQ